MQEYLVFKLCGPLASWGDIAIGETRPSHSYPTKTAISGLLAAALGIERVEETKQLELAKSFGFAVRVDKKGTLLCDYHTTQVPSATALKKVPHATRSDELRAGDLSTILSTREYYCDVCYTVILWSEAAALPYSLAALKEALQRPKFTLFLGRKSCVLGLPTNPQIYYSETIKAALRQADLILNKTAGDLGSDDCAAMYWDSAGKSGMEPLQTIRRKDKLLSRKRWQFADRFEQYALFEKQGDM